MDEGAQLVRAPEVLWRSTMRGVLISTGPDDEPLLCTPPGDVVWELLATPTSAAELYATLAEAYDVDEATIAADVQPLLDTLLDVGALIRRAPEGEG